MAVNEIGSRVLALRPTEIVENPPESIEALRGRGDQVLWIDLVRPTPATMARLAEIFRLHPLAVEDALSRRQRAKAEEYEGFLFVTTYSARQDDGKGAGEIELDEIDVFSGPGFVITVHDGESSVLAEVRRRLAQAPRDLRTTSEYVLYVILDVVVDSYFPVLDAIDDQVERLEDVLFEQPSPQTLDGLFACKRALISMRRATVPQRDMLNLLLRHETTTIGGSLHAYYRDVYDHLLRITEQIDTHRDLLAGALDIYLSITSNRLNEVVKVLTIVTAIFASLAVISGIYGMNFERAFPPFEWRYGFLAALGIMATSVIIMLAVFRRLKWL
jgi:magnesium transporter